MITSIGFQAVMELSSQALHTHRRFTTPIEQLTRECSHGKQAARSRSHYSKEPASSRATERRLLMPSKMSYCPSSEGKMLTGAES